NQVSGATVEAEQLDEQTVRIIVTDELDKQLPRTVPKLVSDQIANPNEPYRVCRRVNILRDYPDDKTKLYPRN
ncbi:hypothetical protein, partial [Acinetobacter baumannii]|uniref:hypothetical protein n=1 Tax=Acinetobacter baumannii TaxID=470 RepID=UPI003AF6D994